MEKRFFDSQIAKRAAINVGNKVRIVDMFTKKQKFLPPEEWVMFKDETGDRFGRTMGSGKWGAGSQKRGCEEPSGHLQPRKSAHGQIILRSLWYGILWSQTNLLPNISIKSLSHQMEMIRRSLKSRSLQAKIRKNGWRNSANGMESCGCHDEQYESRMNHGIWTKRPHFAGTYENHSVYHFGYDLGLHPFGSSAWF